MRRRPRASIEDLRLAIDCLPVATRNAMLEGIRCNEIIVGGYTDGEGGVCPMLAAHRAGGRTSFIHFAKAWDRFANAGKRARRATERELRILTTHLEASVLEEGGPAPDLAAAMTQHQELVARGASPRDRATVGIADCDPRPDRDRSQELRQLPGWAWMRVVRRYDDYERALERLATERGALASAGEPELEPARPA